MKFIVLSLLASVYALPRHISCPSGEVSDQNGICIEPRFIQGCHQYSSTLTCAKCQYKYKINQNGLCQYLKQTGQPCCLSKDSGKCNKCNIGLQITSSGACKQNTIIGCLQKNQEGSQCINCASDYYLSNGKCEQGIKQCDKYMSQTSKQICTSCKKFFSLVNNACLKNKILGCQYQVGHKCEKCYQPFRKKEDHCQITNCLTYNDFGCTACECGFYLNPQNICRQIQPGCIRYQRGICSDCQNRFKLRGGSCIMQGCKQLDFLTCTKCQAQYDLVDGACKLKNCFIWDNGLCSVCDKQFVTVQGKCVPDYRSQIIRSN